jgi:hypothetical protein
VESRIVALPRQARGDWNGPDQREEDSGVGEGSKTLFATLFFYSQCPALGSP